MSRSVSAPSSVTKTSPCWNGLMVPGSTFKYGSNFCALTERPRAFRSRPSDAATMPLPSAETTPPVTKTNLATGWHRSRRPGRIASCPSDVVARLFSMKATAEALERWLVQDRLDQEFAELSAHLNAATVRWLTLALRLTLSKVRALTRADAKSSLPSGRGREAARAPSAGGFARRRGATAHPPRARRAFDSRPTARARARREASPRPVRMRSGA